MSMTVQIRAVKMLPIKIGIPKSIFKAIAAPINSAKAVAAAAIPSLGSSFANVDRMIWDSIHGGSTTIVHDVGNTALIPLVDIIDGPGEEVVLCGVLVTWLVRHTKLRVPAIIVIAMLVRGSLHMGNDAFLQALGYAGVMGALSAAFFLRFRRILPLIIGHLLWNLTTTNGLAPHAFTLWYRSTLVPLLVLVAIAVLAWFVARDCLDRPESDRDHPGSRSPVRADDRDDSGYTDYGDGVWADSPMTQA